MSTSRRPSRDLSASLASDTDSVLRSLSQDLPPALARVPSIEPPPEPPLPPQHSPTKGRSTSSNGEEAHRGAGDP